MYARVSGLPAAYLPPIRTRRSSGETSVSDECQRRHPRILEPGRFPVPDTPPSEPSDEPSWVEHGWHRNPGKPPIVGLIFLFALAIVVGGAIAIAIWLLITAYFSG
jgi:hypothetical protein